MHRPSLAVAALVALLALGGLAAPTGAATGVDCTPGLQYRSAACGAPAECSGGVWVNIAGQGPSCPAVGGLWWVRLSNGDYAQTHGGDPIPAAASTAGPPAMAASGSTGGSGSGDGISAGPSYTEPAATQYLGYYIGGQYGYAHSAPPVHCVGGTAFRQQIVYAVPSDMADPKAGIDMYNHGSTFTEITAHRAQLVRELRHQVAEINWWLFENAMLHGANRTYNFQCDKDGQPSVIHALLPTKNPTAAWGTIAGDLAALGYKDPRVKYWVYYATHPGTVAPTTAGQGSACTDDRLVLSNCSNTGPSYAINYNFNRTDDGWPFEGEILVTMHESGHTLGAVQDTTPHSSLSKHCNDGYDVMCYADGGAAQCSAAGGNMGQDGLHCETNCTATDTGTPYSWIDYGFPIMVYDCGSDDYFNPHPASGEYLATHWNIGNPMMRFLAVGRDTQCGDAADNDHDGLSDGSDIGCSDPRDDDENFSCPLQGLNSALNLGLGLSGTTCVTAETTPDCSHSLSYDPTVSGAWNTACDPPMGITLGTPTK